MFLNDIINIVSTLGTYPVIKDLPGFAGLIKSIWELDNNLHSAQSHYFKFQKDFSRLSQMSQNDIASFLENYYEESQRDRILMMQP